MEGNGTSLISLQIPSSMGQFQRATQMLKDEFGVANNIKSRVNKLAVQGAIKMAQNQLKKFATKLPENGIVIFCGNTNTHGKQSISTSPLRPVTTFSYKCDSKFHTSALTFATGKTFGFIICDGNGCLFGTVNQEHKQILHTFSVTLPKKHCRGGQSQNRFARLRDAARFQYVVKCCESAKNCFVDGASNLPIIEGLIVAGSADLKSEIVKSDRFHSGLKKLVLKLIDTSYGMENGFAQAIDQSVDLMQSTTLIDERKLLQHFFQEIARDRAKYCFGIKDTFVALEMGAVETLLISENLMIDRIIFINDQTKEQKIEYVSNDDETTNIEKGFSIQSKTTLIEWIADNYKDFGANLQFVSDRLPYSDQFSKGFGGIGGLLRWPIQTFSHEQEEDDLECNEEEDDEEENDENFQDIDWDDIGF